MLAAALRRLGQMLFVMFGISVVVFLIFFATPGADPAARIAGRNASPETLAAVRASFGLDQPLPVQYALMMERLFVTGDLTSFVNRGMKVVPAVARAESRPSRPEMSSLGWPVTASFTTASALAPSAATCTVTG